MRLSVDRLLRGRAPIQTETSFTLKRSSRNPQGVGAFGLMGVIMP